MRPRQSLRTAVSLGSISTLDNHGYTDVEEHLNGANPRRFVDYAGLSPFLAGPDPAF